MKKLLLFLGLFVFITTCITNNYYTEGLLVDPYLLVEYNVVIYKDDPNYGIRGTCGGTVIVSTTEVTQVLTAAHCVDDYEIDYWISPEDYNLYSVKVIMMDKEYRDIALLETIDNPIPVQRTATIRDTEPELLEDIWITGYPAGVGDALSKGVVSKLYEYSHWGYIMHQFDVTCWYGNSGGGVFDKHGRLISVNSQFGPQGGAMLGWLYGPTVEDIRRFIYDQE